MRFQVEPFLHVLGATGMIVTILIALWVHDGLWWPIVVGGVGAIVLKRPWIRKGKFFLENRFGHLVRMDNVLVSMNPVKFYTSWVEIAEAVICFVGLLLVAK